MREECPPNPKLQSAILSGSILGKCRLSRCMMLLAMTGKCFIIFSVMVLFNYDNSHDDSHEEKTNYIFFIIVKIRDAEYFLDNIRKIIDNL